MILFNRWQAMYDSMVGVLCNSKFNRVVQIACCFYCVCVILAICHRVSKPDVTIVERGFPRIGLNNVFFSNSSFSFPTYLIMYIYSC